MSITFNGVKASDTIETFRNKSKIPTKRWTDLMGAANAHAFTVAGATKVDLLNDLHGAVLAAIENGESIGQFRKRFDSIVSTHGWKYKGKRGWRTRVIYDNNLRSAHMAGRWQQIQRTKKNRPYLIYKTVDDKRVRDEHRAWHNLILPIDDSWWDTHFPPNGWGCRCNIRTASDRELNKQNLSVSDSPSIKNTDRVNTRTGEFLGTAPEGIDTGWDFNPGKAWLGPDKALGEKVAILPKKLRDNALQAINTPTAKKARSNSWQAWLEQNKGKSNGQQFGIGHLPTNTIDAIGNKARSQSTAIIISDTTVNDAAKGISDKLLSNLANSISSYDAVIYDSAKKSILIVLADKVSDNKSRAIIRVDGNDKNTSFNKVTSIEVVKLSSITGNDYDVLDGKLPN